MHFQSNQILWREHELLPRPSYNGLKGFKEKQEVNFERPAIYVLKVKFHPFLERNVIAIGRYLPYAGNPWSHG